MATSIPYFNDDDIRKCLKYADLIPLMSDVLADYSGGKDVGFVQPTRLTVPIDETKNR